MKQEFLTVGLMSGTSLDGVDAGVFRIILDKEKVKIDTVKAETYPFEGNLRQEILDVTGESDRTLPRLTLLNMRLGEVYADCVETLLKKAGVPSADVAVIGSHGQTIHHIGTPEDYLGRPQTGTLQIGEAAVIAQRTGIPVVNDFRTADMAAGGGGAPLVPLLDRILAEGVEGSVAFQNIGGIGNVGYVPEAAEDSLMAFDTGPGNMLIDILTERQSGGKQHYDRDGLIGKQGKTAEALLKEWMSHPYLKTAPPKSTGRELFGNRFFEDFPLPGNMPLEDLIRTAAVYTARTIADSYRRWLPGPPERVIVTGGGAHNPLIMEELKKELGESSLVTTGDEAGIPTDYKEAAAFALMALYYMQDIPGNVPAATGAAGPVLCGKLSKPLPSGTGKRR